MLGAHRLQNHMRSSTRQGISRKAACQESVHSPAFYPWRCCVKGNLAGLEAHFPLSLGDPGEVCRGHINNEQALANAFEVSHLFLLLNRPMKMWLWPQGPRKGKDLFTFMTGTARSIVLGIKVGAQTIFVFNKWKHSFGRWVNWDSEN